MQPKRQPGPIRRTIIATPVPSSRPATNLALRTERTHTLTQGGRRHKPSMAGAQRNSDGSGVSAWAQPMHLNPFSTPMTAAWSYTVSQVRR